MTAKEQKQYMILAGLLIAIVLVMYFSFFRKSAPVADLGSPVDAAATQTFLPYGTTLDTSIFKDKNYKTLIPPSYPQLNRADVGVTNPFAQ